MNKKIITGILAVIFILVGSAYAVNGNGNPLESPNETNPIYPQTLGNPIVNEGYSVYSETQNITRTASTETICYEDGTCNLVLYSGARFAYEDDTWKKVEEARSLKNAWKLVYIEDDSAFIFEDLDYNYTDIWGNLRFDGNWEDYPDFCTKTSGDVKCKFKLKEKYQEWNNLTEDYNEIEIEHEYEWEYEDGIVTSDKREFKIEVNPLSRSFSFGGNSTTIQLQDADTENLDDVTLGEGGGGDENYGLYTSAGIKTLSGSNSRAYFKFNISSIPVGQQIDEAILYLYNQYGEDGGAVDVGIYHVYNQTWVEGNGSFPAPDCYPDKNPCNYGIVWLDQPCGINFDNADTTGGCNLTAEEIESIDGGNYNQWYNFTVTNGISTDYVNNNPNSSFVIKYVTEGQTGKEFYLWTKEHVTLTPYLNITYSVAPDTTAPDNVGFLAPTPANDTNLSQDNYFVNVSFNDNLDAGSGCELELTNTSGTINYTMTQGANNSEYYFNVTKQSNTLTYFKAYCDDAIGNLNHSETRFVNISKIYPTITIYNASGSQTNDRTPGIDILVIDDDAITTSCYLYFDDVAYDGNAAVNNNTQTTLTVNETLDWGSYSVYVKCSDATGTGTSSTITIGLSDLYFAVENATGDIVWKVDDEGNVESDGGAIYAGNIIAENVFLPAYIFSHTNSSMPNPTGEVWRNVTFGHEPSDLKERIAHTYNDYTNTTFTILDTGIYRVIYTLNFIDTDSSPDGRIAIRVIRNGVEIEGSLFEKGTKKQNADIGMHKAVLANFTAGDKVIIQWIADDTTISMDSSFTYGTHKDTATMSIDRLH